MKMGLMMVLMSLVLPSLMRVPSILSANALKGLTVCMNDQVTGGYRWWVCIMEKTNSMYSRIDFYSFYFIMFRTVWVCTGSAVTGTRTWWAAACARRAMSRSRWTASPVTRKVRMWGGGECSNIASLCFMFFNVCSTFSEPENSWSTRELQHWWWLQEEWGKKFCYTKRIKLSTAKVCMSWRYDPALEFARWIKKLIFSL